MGKGLINVFKKAAMMWRYRIWSDDNSGEFKHFWAKLHRSTDTIE